MIETLKKLLLEKFKYELEDYALFEISRGKNKILPFTGALFAIACVFLILDRTEVFANFMNIGILIFLLLVLIIVPIAFQKGSKYEAIIVSPKYLIQRVAKSEYVVVEFDEITGFQIANDGIVIKENKKKIILGMDLFREEIEPIIEILEAKGKTFDSEKDFMIRPIIIIIEDNKVSIEDDEKETSTEKIYRKYDKNFPMLTPGFVSEIIFRNSLIEDLEVESGTLVLYLNGFEVKGGHPENTKFESQIANDCIMIFEDVIIDSITKKAARGKDEEIIEPSIDNLTAQIEKAVISDWKYLKGTIELQFSVGIDIIRTSFDYKEVIIGWNEFN